MEPAVGAFPPPMTAGASKPPSPKKTRVIALSGFLAVVLIGAVAVMLTRRSDESAVVAPTITRPTMGNSSEPETPATESTGASSEFNAVSNDPQSFMTRWLDRYVTALRSGDLATVSLMIGGDADLQARWITPGVTEMSFEALQVTKVGEGAGYVRLHVSYVVHARNADGSVFDGPVDLYWTMEDRGGKVVLTASDTTP